MRLAFIGTNSLSLTTAEMLLEEGHDVVIMEKNKERIDTLSDRVGAGFLHGDGTEPEVLRDAEPENTDVLFCLLESNQTNLIASLIARSLGFKRVVPSISDPQFHRICNELGLENTVNPSRAVASHLADMLDGEESLEMSSLIRGDAEVFNFVVGEQDAGDLQDFDLPADTRIICLYRDNEFTLPERIDRLEVGDEVILVCHQKRLAELKRRWAIQDKSSE